MQRILNNISLQSDFKEIIADNHVRSCMIVCGNSFKEQQIYKTIRDLCKGCDWCEFSDFEPNPKYESVVKGLDLFHKNKCDFIIAAGGGSAIDVAKCIKLFSTMNSEENYLEQEIVKNNVPLLAIPTTAGTGSESTRFAVIYHKGEKESISHVSAIPQYVILDASTLSSLSPYQRRATMMDAFCHAVEAFWSIHSTNNSQMLSKSAIKIILDNYTSYLENDAKSNEQMLLASNLAGKAINIAQTTVGHAMCYKITSLYDIAHGHAAALCVEQVWGYMLENINKCIDPRGRVYLAQVFDRIAETMECKSAKEALNKFSAILQVLELPSPTLKTKKDLQVLVNSVNLVRLKNSPIPFEKATLYELYSNVLKEEN